MNYLLVGDEECTFEDILNSLGTSPSSVELAQGWQKFARLLETPQMKVEKFRLDLLHEKKQVLEVVLDIIIDWRSRVSTEATLSKLINILEVDCGWKDMADQLWKISLRQISSHTTWNELHQKTQNMILNTTVNFLGSPLSLLDVLKDLDVASKDSILSTALTGDTILEIINNELINLTAKNIPDEHEYYIPRTLSIRRHINTDIFTNSYSEIFVIDNIDLLEMARIKRNGHFDRSSNQLDKPTARFILLEFKEHFEKICRKAEHKSVHLLKHNSGEYLWIRSYESIHQILSFIKEDIFTLSEWELLLDKEKCSNKFPICIADTPGMGKSLLLASLCRERTLKCPEKLSLFVNLAKFLKIRVREPQTSDVNKNSIKHWIVGYFSAHDFGSEILLSKVINENQEIELFLDGFDEISTKHFELAINFLKCLNNDFQNIQTYITTRPSRQQELEELLGVPSYSILPFDEAQQILCLEKFWSLLYHIPTNPNLQAFAKILVREARSNFSSHECDIAGVPLQCAMLAEIFNESAIEHAKADVLKLGAVVKIQSITEMYSKLMELRFSRINKGNATINVLRIFHQYAAITLLLPQTAEEVLEMIAEVMNIEWEDMPVIFEVLNSIGILIADKTGIRFLHRTYAEFLLAELMIQQIKSGDMRITKFLFGDVLLTHKWGREILVNAPDCPSGNVLNIICGSSDAAKCRFAWKRVALNLNIPPHVIAELEKLYSYTHYVQEDMDILGFLMEYWTEKHCAQKPLSDLVNALHSNNFNTAADVIISTWYQSHFQHETICFFLNSILSNYLVENPTVILPFVTKSPLDQINMSPLDIIQVLQACAFYNHQSLFHLVSHACLNKRRTKFPYSLWGDLVVTASKYGNVNLLQECYTFVEKLEGCKMAEILSSTTDHMKFTFAPLHVACHQGNLISFEFLVQKLGKVVPTLKHLVHSCVQQSVWNTKEVVVAKIELVKKLLKLNPDFLEERDSQGRTPLVVPLVHFEIVKFLVSQGANFCAYDLNSKYNVGHYMAISSSADSFYDFVKYVLDNNWGEIFLKHNINGQSPLNLAFERGKVRNKTIKLLATHLGIKFNNPDKYGCTELGSAVVGLYSKDTLKLMVKLGGNPKRKGVENQTVIHLAATVGNVEAIEYFVSFGCNVNARDSHKRTPLHHATIFGRSNIDQVVRVLLEKQADTNVQDEEGHTPLYYAENQCEILGLCSLNLLREKSKQQIFWKKVQILGATCPFLFVVAYKIMI